MSTKKVIVHCRALGRVDQAMEFSTCWTQDTISMLSIPVLINVCMLGRTM